MSKQPTVTVPLYELVGPNSVSTEDGDMWNYEIRTYAWELVAEVSASVKREALRLAKVVLADLERRAPHAPKKK